ncbi:ASKHA domain-containing protein [Anaerosporobacter sp.]|uniref:ASKHA domain-containing protein n=1 Tax=Anaerosporobacter sp. TaxID=1872529 RepID=UPI00286EB8D0|nr:ASKHA domain-containing protein [Anaerosporobacter sp.]
MQIQIHGFNKTISAEAGENLLDILRAEQIDIPAICGGNGTCGKCKVQVLSGEILPATLEEKKRLTPLEIEDGVRFACQLIVQDNMKIALLDMAGESDAETDRKSKLMKLPQWSLKTIHQDRDRNTENGFGVAFDIGTTTVVGLLWNLETSEPVHVIAKTNPQRAIGADVIARIQYSMKSEESKNHIYELIIDGLNEMIQEFGKSVGDNLLLKRICIVGNTAMSQIAQNRDVSQLVKPPFPKEMHRLKEYTGKETGLMVSDETSIIYLPGIGGHVGSDITAVVVATDMRNYTGVTLAIDIGTNGEIVLAKDGQMVSCSTAAGPAFEGASIQYGMRASKGAIEGVTIHNQGVELQVIEGVEAEGICGSGLIDAIAAMLDIGVIDETGRILELEEAVRVGVSKVIATRLQKTSDGMQFILQYRYAKEPIVITQRDIREVQLAKGAISAGIRILMGEMGITKDSLDRVFLAGAFGSYLKIGSARRIGLLPNISLEKIRSVGNAAGVGASMAVLAKTYQEECQTVAESTRQVELSLHDSFQEEYIRGMNFEK